jgi:hypothetical protein
MFGNGKGQIATEFIVLYSIILLVFVLIFAIITSQRAAILNTQQYSLLQLQAQQIASYINYALGAGSGFSMSQPLGAGFSPLAYTLSMSNMGVIMLKLTQGGQPITAYAFSSGRNMVINGVLVQSDNGVSVYSVPTYSGMLNIANSGGTIYIDASPVTSAGLVGSLIPDKVKEGYLANFNANSVISVADTPSLRLRQPASYTVEAWIHTPARSTAEILGKGGGTAGFDLAFGTSPCGSGQVAFTKFGVGTICGGYPPDGGWHQVLITYNLNKSYMYLDGRQIANASGDRPPASSTAPLTFGVGPTNAHFTGQLANIEIYNNSLTPTQIASLYASGLFGAPVESQNLVGWWPLNSNPNDYSGNSQMGRSANVTYSSAGELDLSVIARNGYPISADPIGVVISNGTATGFTSANVLLSRAGAANAIVVYNSIHSNVTAYAFNGNLSTANSLLDWWPLTLGENAGGVVYDLGQNEANGIPAKVIWSYKQDESSFTAALFPYNPTNTRSNSLTGVVTINSIGSLLDITNTQALTLVAWVKFLGATPGHCEGIFGDGGMVASGVQLMGYTNGGACAAAYVDGVSLGAPSPLLTPGNWTMLTLSVSGPEGTFYLYRNGTLLNSVSSSGPLNLNPTGSLYYIGSDSYDGLDEFNGTITNVQLYDAALTPQQISQIYSEGPASSPPSNLNLSGWWPLAGNANDYSGNNNTGTIKYTVSFVNQEYPFSYNTTPPQQLATFDGGGNITIPNLAVQGAHTFSLWFSSALGSNVTFASDLLSSVSTGTGAFALRLCGVQSNSCTNNGGTRATFTTFLTSGTAWTVPANWNNNNNKIEVIGAGGAGGSERASNAAHGGGGGGYSAITDAVLTPGSTVAIKVGSAGTAVAASAGNPGGDTYLCNSITSCGSINGANVIVGAKGGGGGGNYYQSTGSGGASNKGVGTTTYSGGSGGADDSNGWNGGGGGGAAGLNGAGNPGGNSAGGAGSAGGTGGSGDTGHGGSGGAGGVNSAGSNGNGGSEWWGTYGSGGGGGGGSTVHANGGSGGTYGAGGGGASGESGSVGASALGGAGTGGIIVITYTPSGSSSGPGQSSGQIGVYSGVSTTPTASYQFYFMPRTWYNFVGLFGSSSCSIFINGANVSSGPCSSLPISAGLVVGNGATSSGSPLNFNGQIADVQLYNGLLTPAQIAQLYQQGLPPQYSVGLSAG